VYEYKCKVTRVVDGDVEAKVKEPSDAKSG
jgi:hypothetical protein